MPDRPTVLAFDTSAAHCAAALLSGGRILAEAHEAMTRGQAERLMPMIQKMLRDAGLTLGALDLIGVGIGPGNFTGIRVSVACARGLALGLRIPAVGVSQFELALPSDTQGDVVVTLPAPRAMAYAQTFRNGAPLGAARMIDANALEDQTGATHVTHDPATAPNPAPAIARLVAARAARGHLPDARPAPLYVRPPDAAPARAQPPVV